MLGQPFGVDNDTNWIYIRGFEATQYGTYLNGLQNFSYGFGGFISTASISSALMFCAALPRRFMAGPIQAALSTISASVRLVSASAIWKLALIVMVTVTLVSILAIRRLIRSTIASTAKFRVATTTLTFPRNFAASFHRVLNISRMNRHVLQFLPIILTST